MSLTGIKRQEMSGLVALGIKKSAIEPGKHRIEPRHLYYFTKKTTFVNLKCTKKKEHKSKNHHNYQSKASRKLSFFHFLKKKFKHVFKKFLLTAVVSRQFPVLFPGVLSSSLVLIRSWRKKLSATEQQQKQTMHRSAWLPPPPPPHRAKAHQGKSEAQKTKINACAEHLSGQGNKKGKHTGISKKKTLPLRT